LLKIVIILFLFSVFSTKPKLYRIWRKLRSL